MKKIFNVKKLLVAALSLCMVLGVNVTNAKAASVTTDKINTVGAYYYYVREAGSAKLLGTMYLSKDSATVYNTFTASKDCEEVTAFVSGTSVGYVSNTVKDLPEKGSVIAKKRIANPTQIYGYCTVTYQ